MKSSLTSGRLVVVMSALAMVCVGTVALRSARAQATADPDADDPGKSAKLLATQAQLQQRRMALEQAEREIDQAKDQLLLLLFQRIKSIKSRQGLTPKEAAAFDQAFAAEMARINQAQQQVDAARQALAARQRTVQQAGVAFAGEADIIARLDALERRVAALEEAQ